ncbi:hypothetical protein ACP70R_044259 [Stipagrostis hirtigluma subsp. patula]
MADLEPMKSGNLKNKIESLLVCCEKEETPLAKMRAWSRLGVGLVAVSALLLLSIMHKHWLRQRPAAIPDAALSPSSSSRELLQLFCFKNPPSGSKASAMMFGGVASGPETNLPPMGSGNLPKDANTAASISNLQLVDKDGHG